MEKDRFTTIKQTTLYFEGFEVQYLLLTSAGTPPSYSVYVYLISGEGYCLREAFAQDITTLPQFAVEIFDAVTKGHVTPVTLHEIIEDIIA